MLRWIGVVPKVSAICGKAVVMIVPSRFSMNSAEATIMGTIMVREMGKSMRRACYPMEARVTIALHLRAEAR